MWFLYSNRTCVELTSVVDPNEEQIELITEWSVNSSLPPLQTLLWAFPPLILFFQWETTDINNDKTFHYQYCGPFVQLLKLFCHHANVE